MDKIVIIDDHPLFREGVKQTLNRSGEFQVIFEGGSREDLENFLNANASGIENVYFIVDISLPDSNGFELVPVILDAGGSPQRLIMLSMHDDSSYADHAFECGAFGYVVKSDDTRNLLDCLRSVARGERYTSPGISEGHRTDNTPELVNRRLKDLSKREVAVLKLVAEEKTSREISDVLFLSQRTVENHRAKICSKLNVTGAHGLIAFAIKYRSEITLLDS